MESGFQKTFNLSPIEKITRADISRDTLKPGETEIIMQRHEKYISDLSHERSGSLEPEEAKKTFEQTLEILRKKFEAIPVEERRNVDILVIASNTQHGDAKGMRSFETATQVVNATIALLHENGLDESQLLNSKAKVSEKSIRPSINPNIQAPRFFDDSPEFFAYLKEKHGNGEVTQKFWQAFEEDWEKDERERMGAEGPEDILNRYNKFIEILKNFSDFYHKKNSAKRLIIWPVSHYDTISPYVKNKITKDAPEKYLPVDYGAGISLKIGQDGKMRSNIQGNEYIID